MSKRKLLLKVIWLLAWRIAGIAVFVIVAGFIVTLALGYKVNVDQLTLEPTGAVTINGRISDIEVYVGDVKIGDKLPITVTGLTPTKRLLLEISKADYVSWQKEVVVSAGLVTGVDEVRLWLKSPTVKDAENTVKLQSCAKIKPAGTNDLVINGGEIRFDTHLITRISFPVVAACWFGDDNHIVFATEKKVFIIDGDGDNIATVYEAEKIIKSITVLPNENKVFVTLDDFLVKQVIVAES